MMWTDSDCLDSFKSWIAWLLSPCFSKLGLESSDEDDHISSLLRAEIAKTLIRSAGSKHQDSLTKATQRLKDHWNKDLKVSTDLKPALYSAYLQLGKLMLYIKML